MLKSNKWFSGLWLALPGCILGSIAWSGAGFGAPVGSEWKKHIVQQGYATSTVVAADFDGDGRVDVITTNGGKVRLFRAPDWQEAILGINQNCIHSEVMDVDGDGDADYIGAHSKGPVFWLENPGDRRKGFWTYRVIDDEIDGIHCLLTADVDRDGKLDLLLGGQTSKNVVWYENPLK